MVATTPKNRIHKPFLKLASPSNSHSPSHSIFSFSLHPQEKTPRRKYPLHVSAAPQAPRCITPTAMPCLWHPNPGIKQMWVLKDGIEDNSIKYELVPVEASSFYDSMRTRMTVLSFMYSFYSHTSTPPVKSQSLSHSLPHIAGLPEETFWTPCVLS